MKLEMEDLDSAGEGVFVVNRAGTIVLWNQAAVGMLGYPLSSAVGLACSGLLGGLNEFGEAVCAPGCSVLRALSEGTAVPSFDVCFRTSLCTRLWVHSVVLPCRVGPNGEWGAMHLFHRLQHPPRLKAPYSEGKSTALANTTLADRTLSASYTAPGSGSGQLSKRELEVLRLLVQGESIASIATNLCVSRTTVRGHVQQILEKTNTHSRLQAALYALQEGLVTLGEAQEPPFSQGSTRKAVHLQAI